MQVCVEPNYKQLVEECGGVFIGRSILGYTDLIWFNDKNHSTKVLKVEDITREAILEKLR
jgi:hypothetical protein